MYARDRGDSNSKKRGQKPSNRRKKLSAFCGVRKKKTGELRDSFDGAKKRSPWQDRGP